MIAGHLQLKKGYWYMVLQIRDEFGQPKSKWIATHLPEKGNKKSAEEMLIEARTRYTAQQAMRERGGRIYFDEYMAQWVAGMWGKVSPTTYGSYYNCVRNSICPFFKERGTALFDLCAADIEAYYDHLRTRGVSNNTIIYHHVNIRKALQEAVRKGLIPTNAADRVERPRKEQYVAACYSAEEANRLLRAVQGDRLELVVTLALFYGLRRSEVLGLRWEAVDFVSHTIAIHHSINEATVSGVHSVIAQDKVKRQSSFRTLPLMEPIEKLLLELRAQRYGVALPPPDTYICVDERGELLRPNYLTQGFPKLLKKHGLRQIRFHDLRHSCANALIANRVPLIEVQQWLGHSSISTTADLYSHLEYAVKERSAETLKKI